ncbi:glycosyltransferase [Spirosoma sp. HMF4905]|uniref:Glycosyltransferase n=1 Tax=Spirosoma arboris TaxID=2682092 RepID=A0A7K1SQH1_9BACT|nr:glycosyltransferase [Spirosoma arboris]MVM36027.1 glycosyltransferase [Spirosoma arboris]
MTSLASKLDPSPLNPCQNQSKPWVTVIFICYNHQNYVVKALQSVIEQDYPTIELIVIDNGSTDHSVERINDFIQLYPTIRFIQNEVNLGLNRAFNQGLALARGSYIIDLSADDVLLPSRITKQVAAFEQLPDDYGVVFSNAAYIDANGQETGYHYAIDRKGHSCVTVPTGAVFKYILEAYFICTPTMMMRRDVLHELGGYDEMLSYEDFDFWVRSSRHYRYAYLDEVLTQKRQLPNALSTQIVLPNNSLLPSTLIVCQKAFKLCATPDEFQALAFRIQTFIRKAFYTEQFKLAAQFGHLLRQIAPPNVRTQFILVLCRLHVPVNSVYRSYHKWRTISNRRNRLG